MTFRTQRSRRMAQALGAVTREAMNDRGSAMAQPTMVAMMAIWMVSMSGSIVLSKKAQLTSRTSPMMPAPPAMSSSMEPRSSPTVK